MTEKQLQLKQKHGTPEDFKIACVRAVPDFISYTEAYAAADKYEKEWIKAGVSYLWNCRLEFKLQDAWVGVFWKWKKDVLVRDEQIVKRLDVWVCPLPCVPIHFSWLKTVVLT